MYEELIKALKNCGYPGCGHYCSNGCVMSPDGTATCEQTPLLRKAANVIEELSAKYEKALRDLVKHVELPKWIPVTERLPDNIDEEVLVCNEGYGKDGTGFATVAVYNGNGWLECWERKQYLACITHWMPLPEPPKEGK